MTEEKKKELFPFFALAFSQQLDPEKYGAAGSYEEWSSILEKNPEDVDKISEAAAQLTDEQWSQIEIDYTQEEAAPKDLTKIAKKGTKLNYLKKLRSYKKGDPASYKKGASVRKCSCGCNLIPSKEKGGKMSYKCSCGCKLK